MALGYQRALHTRPQQQGLRTSGSAVQAAPLQPRAAPRGAVSRARPAAPCSGLRLRVVVAQAPPFIGGPTDTKPEDAAKHAAAKPHHNNHHNHNQHHQHQHTASPYGNAILLQGFAWDSWKKGGGNWYGRVQAAIPALQALHVSHVWLPPPSHSVSKEGYLPGQLYDLDSEYGNQAQLTELCAALKAAGISPMADIVINHRCADEQDPANGVYNNFLDEIDHAGKAIDWGRWAITSNDPHFQGSGNPDTGDDFGAAPDLDHANPELRAALVDWLNWLKTEVGFVGWRFDYVRGYAASFIAEYVDKTVGKDVLNVGEYWTEAQWQGEHLDFNQDGARQVLCNWLDKSHGRSTAFDFPTKSLLQEACRHTQYNRLRDNQGKAPGLLGWWPSKAVTFIENHDTGSTQQHWPFPNEYVGAGYAYLLTHPGIPSIFWDHVFEWGEPLRAEIAALTDLRRRAGLHSESGLEVLAAEPDMYVARVGGRVTVKLGPRYDMGGLLPKEAEGWKFVSSGKDWAVWEKAG
ncbi:hypothetical protein HYH02_014760 [Chlamydomonas schloesseri]|uniref:alpha-amylase n=1 Tax=Chlamydomonas schloesseri TaxID=2026947 RepID=A0A835STY7_9CHLO|nr:hypothetical protein HYH02_014760 [Chlamydomonas schloesseri]|eukprot:KAG2426720.1 hypothetical protein HYH02_014760 [Chlamydomonas schloesseri]